MGEVLRDTEVRDGSRGIARKMGALAVGAALFFGACSTVKMVKETGKCSVFTPDGESFPPDYPVGSDVIAFFGVPINTYSRKIIPGKREAKIAEDDDGFYAEINNLPEKFAQYHDGEYGGDSDKVALDVMIGKPPVGDEADNRLNIGLTLECVKRGVVNKETGLANDRIHFPSYSDKYRETEVTSKKS